MNRLTTLLNTGLAFVFISMTSSVNADESKLELEKILRQEIMQDLTVNVRTLFEEGGSIKTLFGSNKSSSRIDSISDESEISVSQNHEVYLRIEPSVTNTADELTSNFDVLYKGSSHL